MSSDALSEVLRAVRLSGAVFFDVRCGAPWVAESPPARDVAPAIMPGLEHVIEYHVIIEGACWGGIVGEPPTRLGAGDVIVFPQGDAHVMSSAPGMRGNPALELHKRPVGGQLPIVVNNDGGGDERTHVVCGFIGCDATPFNPLLAALPRALHVRGPAVGGATAALVQMALAESSLRGSGAECVLARVSELLFVEIIRRYVAELPKDSAGWLGGLRDPVVGRALAALHDRPAHDFTLDDLAKEAGASRSVLAERFTHFVGVPPMQYLLQWRMQLAAGLLSTGGMTVAEVATRVGYGAEAAFARAFKRVTGVAPGGWRRAAGA